MVRILIVEQDKNTGEAMQAVLQREGFSAVLAGSGPEALDILESRHIDLMVTAVLLPGMDGFALTQELRSVGSTLPILIVTAKKTKKDKRRGFIVGADDYMVKPADEEELLLRVKALLRRARIVSSRRLCLGSVTLDCDAMTVSREKESFTLPQKEFLLLFKLLSYPGIIFSRMQLMDEIWGMETTSNEHTVSVHIGRLRKRFGHWPEFGIVTVRGLGYKAVKHLD